MALCELGRSFLMKMKMKTIPGILLIFLLIPAGALAYTAVVSVDSSLDLNRIDYFSFESTVPISLNADPPELISYITNWTIAGQPATFGVIAWDNGAFSGGANPLSPGNLLSIQKNSEVFELSNFVLWEYITNPPGYVDYPLPFSVVSTPLIDGIQYTYTAVPIPPTLLLLGAGLAGLAAMRWRKGT
jgi:hypothetical protein